VVSGESGLETVSPTELMRLRERGVAVAVTQATGPDAQIPCVRVDMMHGAHPGDASSRGPGPPTFAYVGNRADSARGLRDPRSTERRPMAWVSGCLCGRPVIDYDKRSCTVADPTARGGATCRRDPSLPRRPAAHRCVSVQRPCRHGHLHGLMAGVRVPD